VIAQKVKSQHNVNALARIATCYVNLGLDSQTLS